ncbi:MAG: EamA family transporter [Rhizobiales bacterium]|nr:EamA family transporter [Hyphomicrobiales bacterium]NRB13507.1 EamA family transporter [Hyphomicrobiales bacterium]
MKLETPIFVTFAAILTWSLLSVSGRVILLKYSLAPATFVFIQMLSGGMALVLLSPKRIKTIGLMPLTQYHTWAFGGFRVVAASFYAGALIYLSAANLSFMGASNVTMSVLYVWFVLNRKPTLRELPGHIIIVIMWVLLALQFDGQFNNPGIWLLLVSQFIITIAITLGETHPLNQSNNSGDTFYLTGMVLVASAAILLSLSYIASRFESQLPSDFYPTIRAHVAGFILEDLLNPAAWLLGIITGVSFRAAAIYYSLRAVKLTSSEFYLGSMAFMPFTNMALEDIAMRFGFLPTVKLEFYQILFGSIICAASLYIIYCKRAKR